MIRTGLTVLLQAVLLTGALVAQEPHFALRDWIESRLPAAAISPDGVKQLEGALQAEGKGEVKLRVLPELDDSLFVIAGVGAECGFDEAVYLYHFDAHGRTRVFEDHPGGRLQFMDAALELAEPDADGRRLLVAHYITAQCSSTWMAMAYSVYRLSAGGASAERLLAAQHDFWLTDAGPEYILKPNELIIQFLGSSMDADIHNRTRIHRYSFAGSVRRLDPVALQPQDFVEEWLTRPWTEMQSRSAAGTRRWHGRLYAESVSAEYQRVMPCTAKPGHWLIGLDIYRIGGKRLGKPRNAWFLVQDPGDFHYGMAAVGSSMPAAQCPGAALYTGPAEVSEKHPSLSAAELRKLK